MIDAKKLKNMPVGQFFCRKYGKSNNVPAMYIRRLSAREYKLEYVAPLMAKYDENSESVTCGCHLQGKSHGHAEKMYTSLTDVVLAFNSADAEIDECGKPTFSKFVRIGE